MISRWEGDPCELREACIMLGGWLIVKVDNVRLSLSLYHLTVDMGDQFDAIHNGGRTYVFPVLVSSSVDW